MNIERNIERFESELSAVDRQGMDRLLDYIRKSDFYTAPASTRYHLSCEGGLLQHSLDVLDALRGILQPMNRMDILVYKAAGVCVCEVPKDSATIAALLHDICKTHYYKVSTRNAKNEQTGAWEKVPFYTIDDKMPLGHGAKSAMILKEYIPLTTQEMYAIWYHMGYAELSHSDVITLGQAVQKQPFIWALHTADMMASKFMEDETDVKDAWRTADDGLNEAVEPPEDLWEPPEEPQVDEYASEQDPGEWAEAPSLGTTL